MSPNVVWRSPTLHDLQGIAALAAISDQRDGTLEATLFAELASRLRSDRDIDRLSRVVAVDGRVIAAGWVRASGAAGSSNRRACLYAFATPDQPGLYAELLAWLDGIAATALESGGVLRIERVLSPSTAALPEQAIALYEALGYQRFYVEHEMSCSVTGTPAGGRIDGISIAPWTSARHAEIRDAYNDAFRQRGFEGYAPDQWGEAYYPEDFRPELSFIALDRDRVVGFTFCTVLGDSDPWTDPAISGAGWIDIIGVRPLHQGRGIASSLLACAMAALNASGVDRAVLRVNEDNGRAENVYRRLGFKTVRKHIVYKKAL